MRIVLQRVSQASVDVEGKRIAEIDQGLLLLVGIAAGDSDIDLAKTAKKMVDLRIFEDEKHKKIHFDRCETSAARYWRCLSSRSVLTSARGGDPVLWTRHLPSWPSPSSIPLSKH